MGMTGCGRASHFSSSFTSPASSPSQAGTWSSLHWSLQTLNISPGPSWNLTPNINGGEGREEGSSACHSECPAPGEESDAVGGTTLVSVISSAVTVSARWADFYSGKSD